MYKQMVEQKGCYAFGTKSGRTFAPSVPQFDPKYSHASYLEEAFLPLAIWRGGLPRWVGGGGRRGRGGGGGGGGGRGGGGAGGGGGGGGGLPRPSVDIQSIGSPAHIRAHEEITTARM